MVNPASIFKLKSAFGQFQANHPKVVSYFQTVFGSGVPEGSVIEITVTKPGAQPITTNLKVSASDLELVNTLKDLK
ncbi:hypothetical protein SAMN02910400_02067 [Lachnospiraceae bacterium C10]|jgi:hypothetical protein|nr:hypothetical protein SAMN02910400_02067 [Lachnospiraceae bacterium C10]SDW86071.1 hypothetical protein SAMN05216391_12048 [Lachnospiraceae bacterium KHCPX20]